jgi:hypothetical protein
MSWAFFVSLHLTVPAAAWQTLAASTPKASPVPADWPDTSDFGKSFRSSYWSGLDESFQKILFAKSPSWTQLKSESVREVSAEGEVTRVRFLVCLDKSLLENAAVVAALFHAAREVAGAEGELVIANDGTGPDENGWVHTLKSGAIEMKKIADAWEYAEAYGAALFEGGLDG